VRWRLVSFLLFFVCGLLKADRDKQWSDLVLQAARAAEDHDTRIMYQLVRRLSSYRPRAIPAVRCKDGTLADSPEANKERWLEHFLPSFFVVLSPLQMLKTSGPSLRHPCLCLVPILRPSVPLAAMRAIARLFALCVAVQTLHAAPLAGVLLS
jgi:hypothetical protein